ncbi:ABC transporter permease [Chitinophaga flava]|uniref:ABC transporter permease n=1 Tax=Chitinophaga flava TaxID=2259036 RepID=A0A365XV29_9BACT|nr:ABC transporter permease [Chitinophaga flava]RBL89968.1 ABC transporter permease [Chitinophaga flava]
MLQHLFKLIWNKKKHNFLIMLELFFSFLVMFAVFTLVINYYKAYREPRGFEYKNVWNITRNTSGSEDKQPLSRDSAMLLEQMVKQQIRSMPEVEQVSYTSNNTPYARTRIFVNNLTYGKVKTVADIYTVEDNYATLMNMKLLSGRWFNRDDNAAGYTPIVINTKLKDKLFRDEDPINKVITLLDRSYRVIGVVNDMKNKGDYVMPESGFYTRPDSTFYGNSNTIQVSVKPGTGASFEAQLFKTLSSLARNASIEIEHLEKRRAAKNKEQLVPLVIILIVTLFFIINVALGLFGVLWHNINKRRGEIGLRRAIGATKKDIAWQLIGETMVLSTLSMLTGCFFAIQFPLMNIFDLSTSTYLLALVLSIVFIYVLVIICALYPGKQAADIYPAIALHEN